MDQKHRMAGVDRGEQDVEHLLRRLTFTFEKTKTRNRILEDEWDVKDIVLAELDHASTIVERSHQSVVRQNGIAQDRAFTPFLQKTKKFVVLSVHPQFQLALLLLHCSPEIQCGPCQEVGQSGSVF